MGRKVSGDCLKIDSLIFTTGLQTLPVLKQASRAIIQVYTDAAGITAITPAVMSYTPIIKLAEDGTSPGAGFAGPGFGLFNGAIYEIIGQVNIAQTKLLAFAGGYTIYCKIFYYK